MTSFLAASHRIAALDADKAKAVRAILEANTGFNAVPDVIAQVTDLMGWRPSCGRQGMALLEDLYHFANDTTDGDLPSIRLALLLDEAGQDDRADYRQIAIGNLEQIWFPAISRG